MAKKRQLTAIDQQIICLNKIDSVSEEELSEKEEKRLKGKKALREQITQEKQIRAKEA